MNDIDRRFTAWLSGYYEDFQSMRVIGEGEDYSEASFFTNRRDSHAGNMMALQAYNNSRFAFDYLTRSFAKKAPIPLIGSAATSEAASLHNEGPSQWLTHDPNRLGNSFWEGRASLTYPDTIGDAASVRTFGYPRRADYSHFASGWGTHNTYWVRHGDADATYERASFVVASSDGNPFGSTSTRGYGKFFITGQQPNDESGVPEDRETGDGDRSNYRKHKVMMNSSLCGVYLGETGEVAATNSNIGLPYAYLHPIKSPSGKPFFRHSMSRRYADWLSAARSDNGSSKNRYTFGHSQFVDEGDLGSDDQWFSLNKTTQTLNLTGQTYSIGDTSITIPSSLSPVIANVLDPTNDRHLPDKTGTAKLSITLDGDTLYYESFSTSSGSITFNLSTALTVAYIQPSITYSTWTDVAAGATSVVVYNLTTAGTPSPTPVFQYRQDTSDGLGYPMICLKDSSNNVITTDARSTNGESGVQDSPTFSVTSNTTLGYTYYRMVVNLVGGHAGFATDPDDNFAKDPFYATYGNVYGRLEVGDYITIEGQSSPEKITSDNGDGSFDTDATYASAATVNVRQATYGSYASPTSSTTNQGRAKDGMFGFQPVIVGDTELNAQTSGERFTIRLANQSWGDEAANVPSEVDATYMLSVGYNQTESGFELNERGNMAGSKAAITHIFRPVDGTGMSTARNTLFTMFQNGVAGKTTYTMDQLWYDIEIVVDFVAQSYFVFHDGAYVSQSAFNPKAGGGLWSASDFYGWSLGVQLQSGVDTSDETGWQTIVTMIDRVGYIYALSDRLTNAALTPDIQQDDVLVDSFKVRSMVDGISQFEITLHDDSDLLNLPQLASGRPNWKVLLFRDSDYRPIHSSIIHNVQWKQHNKKKTKELVLKGKDSLGELDFQFPYFDIGQENGAPSFVAAYRRYEVSKYAEIFHFGATSLLNLNAFLGLDEDSKGSTGEYLPRYDQRMRLYSGHPIQLYSNENVNGPNYVEDAWEVSRAIDHFKPDPNDSTKTRAVFTSDAIKYAEDMIPAGVKVAIKGNWKNVGVVGSTYSSSKSTPNFCEKGYLTSNTSTFTPEITPHNTYRGEWTVEQAETVLTSDHLSNGVLFNVADTSIFPSSGTIKVGGTGAIGSGSTTYTYSSKTATQLVLTSGTIGKKFGAGTVVRETTATNYIVIDKEWTRSLQITKIEDDGGFLKFTMETDPAYGTTRYELMGGSSDESAQSTLAKNDRMTPTTSPNADVFRIYIEANSDGIAHDSNLSDLPSEVYTSSSVTTNDNTQAVITTTKSVSSLSSGLQAALPITLAGGLADGLEADLAYMTFPKQREGSFSLRNVGSSYNYRNAHTRWARDLPQSLWFQKTFGKIGEYPYGATAWRGQGYLNAAISDLGAAFNSGTDTTITLDDVTKFPYAGVCEIWSNSPNPFHANSDQAVMLTSFTFEGKDFANNRLNNVKFADPNKGLIATSGGAGNRVVVARNIDGDYKHCFVLFADMRNDGSADADGGYRKENFGLLHPIQQNYKLKVVWADTGKDFVDLKLGADADIWQLNSNKDPSTDTAWSDNPSAVMLDYDDAPILIGGRSDETEVSTFYHDWEDKAGAFLVVDLSKFFNVNTEANLGRIAQASGGNKQLGEYLIEGAGTPTLIDNYYYHASASFQNSAAPILQHFNSYRWVVAKTVLTQDVVSANPATTTTSETLSGATTIEVADNSTFPASATTVLINGDTFAYTSKGGELSNIRPANLGDDVTGDGTFTTTGGGGSGATGSYKAAFEIDQAATRTSGITVGSGWSNITYDWRATTGRARGTIQASSGSLVASSFTISQNDYYKTAPTIEIVRTTVASRSATGSITPSLESTGRLAFGENFTITNAGSGYTSSPTFNLSTSSVGTAVADVGLTQLNGVTGVGQTHPAGSPVTFSSTVTNLAVEDTTDFPSKLGVNSFAGKNTAGVIEAKTTDANGNEYDMKYVFTYTSKTSTSLNGVKYRPVRQGESVDLAAAGLWSDDTFTISGIPSMKAEGTVIRASLGSAFPMGFMLKLEGKVKTANGGNYHEHDKIRIYQMGALYNDWFKQITMPSLSDINNVPIMVDYNVDGNTSGAGTVESFGSVTDGQNKSVFQVMRTMAQSAGVGDGSSLLTLNFQMGRDNRMEFRPTYNSGLSLTRSKLKVSNLKTSKAASFSHVRVLYNGGSSFVTFPALSYKQNVRFKFVSATSVTSYEQALEIAKQEYQKKKEPAFKVEAEIIRESNESQREGPMLANARYGYIADPAIQLTGRNGGYWTAGRGGLHFTGQNNALHGNIHGYGLLSLLTYQAPANIGIGIGGYNGADDYTETYGTGNVKYPTNDLYNMFPWTQMYYWYGGRSVSYAVQIVHIPKGMPKVSETTGEELRIFIEDVAGSLPVSGRDTNDTDTKKFKIFVADYDFDETRLLTRCPKLQATQHGIESITTKGSGFFEMPIPESYWSAGNAAGYKMVISVNAEYLNAVARHKTADKFGGNFATSQSGVNVDSGQTLPTFSNANEFSIFPLGIREYPELGSSGKERTAYYAPRIHITDDVNFIPGTYAQYTDAYIDIDETLYITKVEYEYSTKNLDRVKLELERESGRIPEGLESYLATNPFEDTGASGGGVGGGGGGQNTPPAGGGGTSGRGGDDFVPVTPDAFPLGYTGGQVGTGVGVGGFVPIMGGVDADLGGVQNPIFGVDYVRLNTDTGQQQAGQEGAMSVPSMNANNLDDATLGKLTGTMSIDNLLPAGIQGIPGQPRPSKIPQKTRSIEGIDTKFLSADGEAAETDEGWILPGAAMSGVSEAITNVQHSLTMSATIPMDSAQPVIGMTAVISCEVLTDSTFSLTTTITCKDTNEKISHTHEESMTAAANGISRKTIPLIPQQYFESAGVEGRQLIVSIVRKPEQGNDDADYSSVVIHGVQFENVVHNNQGAPTTDNLEAFAGKAKDTTSNSLNLNDNSNPL